MFKQSIPGAASAALGKPEQLAFAQAFCANEVLLEALETGMGGLAEAAISDRLQRDGLNEISREKPPHWTMHLRHAFKNPFIVVLLLLAGVQLFTEGSDLTEPIIIAVMVAISVLLSFTQEYRSSHAAERLKAMVRNTATVIRQASDGHSERIEVPVVELVVGDIVHLAAGDMLPADLRLLAAKDLFVSQAILTGESLPVEKSAPSRLQGHRDAWTKTSSALDLATIGYMGTNVVSGTATAAVLATGSRSYLGSLAHDLSG